MRRQAWLGRSSGWIVAAGVLAGGVEARAQFPVASGPPINMGSPTVITSARPVVTTETPIVSDTRVRYALPPFSEERRKARTANRYTVARPVYAGRPGVSFAPYSDYYFPRTIGAKETVFTTRAGGSVPVGEAAFRQPTPPGVPVFPRR